MRQHPLAVVRVLGTPSTSPTIASPLALLASLSIPHWKLQVGRSPAPLIML